MSDYAQFPARLARGVHGGPNASVEITTLASGHEIRNRRTAHMRRRYTLPGVNRPIAEARQLLDFYHERGGPSEPFLFRDPLWHCTASASTPTRDDVILGTGNGQQTTFEIPTDSGFSIVWPNAASLIGSVDGHAVYASWNGSQRNVQFEAAPSSASTVSVGFLFDILVRFENTQLAFTHVADGAAFHDDIVLMEVLA